MCYQIFVISFELLIVLGISECFIIFFEVLYNGVILRVKVSSIRIIINQCISLNLINITKSLGIVL